jgi:peptidoglycan hydrolase-like protein with peptidoglycan-binding domain
MAFALSMMTASGALAEQAPPPPSEEMACNEAAVQNLLRQNMRPSDKNEQVRLIAVNTKEAILNLATVNFRQPEAADQEAIKQVQEGLNHYYTALGDDAPFFSLIDVDGNFGPRTAEAVIAFAQDEKLDTLLTGDVSLPPLEGVNRLGLFRHQLNLQAPQTYAAALLGIAQTRQTEVCFVRYDAKMLAEALDSQTETAQQLVEQLRNAVKQWEEEHKLRTSQEWPKTYSDKGLGQYYDIFGPREQELGL